MNIKIKGLNSNETYCCSRNDVLKIFGNEKDINISFGCFGISRNEKNNNEYIQKEYGIGGRIVLGLGIQYDCNCLKNKSFMFFYIMKKDDQINALKNKFIEEVLPKLYKLYKEVSDSSNDKLKGHKIFYAYVSIVNKDFAITDFYL